MAILCYSNASFHFDLTLIENTSFQALGTRVMLFYSLLVNEYYSPSVILLKSLRRSAYPIPLVRSTDNQLSWRRMTRYILSDLFNYLPHLHMNISGQAIAGSGSGPCLTLLMDISLTCLILFCVNFVLLKLTLRVVQIDSSWSLSWSEINTAPDALHSSR